MTVLLFLSSPKDIIVDKYRDGFRDILSSFSASHDMILSAVFALCSPPRIRQISFCLMPYPSLGHPFLAFSLCCDMSISPSSTLSFVPVQSSHLTYKFYHTFFLYSHHFQFFICAKKIYQSFTR